MDHHRVRVRNAGERHDEATADRDADGLAVERIAGRRVEKHRADTERCGIAEYPADIVVVGQTDQADDKRAGRQSCEKLNAVLGRAAAAEGENATVNGKAYNRLHDPRRRYVDRDRRSKSPYQIPQDFHPVFSQKHRVDFEMRPCRQNAQNDLALRDELVGSTGKVALPNAAVVLDARIGDVGDEDRQGHFRVSGRDHRRCFARAWRRGTPRYVAERTPSVQSRFFRSHRLSGPARHGLARRAVSLWRKLLSTLLCRLFCGEPDQFRRTMLYKTDRRNRNIFATSRRRSPLLVADQVQTRRPLRQARAPSERSTARSASARSAPSRNVTAMAWGPASTRAISNSRACCARSARARSRSAGSGRVPNRFSISSRRVSTSSSEASFATWA